MIVNFRFRVCIAGRTAHGVNLHDPTWDADFYLINDYDSRCRCGKYPMVSRVAGAVAYGQLADMIQVLKNIGPCPCGTPEWIV